MFALNVIACESRRTSIGWMSTTPAPASRSSRSICDTANSAFWNESERAVSDATKSPCFLMYWTAVPRMNIMSVIAIIISMSVKPRRSWLAPMLRSAIACRCIRTPPAQWSS
jgi:hypothetical protein